MPVRNPIMPNSVFSDQIPPHLKPKTRDYFTNAEIRELKGLLGKTDLLSKYNNLARFKQVAKIDSFRADIDTTIAVTDLNSPSTDYLLPFTENLKGDRYWDYQFIAGLKGRYYISGFLEVYFLPSEIKDYIELWVGAVTDEYVRLKLYKNNTFRNTIGSQFARSFDASANYYYHNNITLGGGDIVDLDRGDKIDLRLNLYEYLYTFNPSIKLTGNFNVFFINDR